VTNFTEH